MVLKVRTVLMVRARRLLQLPNAADESGRHQEQRREA
jgi:hypothetical protein